MLEMFKDFWRKLFNMNRLCEDCQGQGRWQETTTDAQGLTEIKTFYCESCKGRGFITSYDDTDEFDLGGVGVTEFDNED
jgi:DnaJ-class molecular chaperone